MSERKPGVYWDKVWNPLVGCMKVSAGCKNCWAEGFARRFQNHPNEKIKADYAGVADSKGWTGKVNLLPHKLSQPLKWRKPRVVSVEFQGDLFNDAVPDEYILEVFSTMNMARQHTFLLLTKRAERMLRWFHEYGLVPDGPGGITGSGEVVPTNVWLGVSVEHQEAAEQRIPLLLQTPAAKRFVSVEPMLGPVGLSKWLEKGSGYDTLDWVIAGGESGPGARQMNPDWALSLRNQCLLHRTWFWFKQHGPNGMGREMDGIEWNEVPR